MIRALLRDWSASGRAWRHAHGDRLSLPGHTPRPGPAAVPTTRSIVLLAALAIAPGVAVMLAVRAWDRDMDRLAAEEAALPRAVRAARQESLWAGSRAVRTGPATGVPRQHGGAR